MAEAIIYSQYRVINRPKKSTIFSGINLNHKDEPKGEYYETVDSLKNKSTMLLTSHKILITLLLIALFISTVAIIFMQQMVLANEVTPTAEDLAPAYSTMVISIPETSIVVPPTKTAKKYQKIMINFENENDKIHNFENDYKTHQKNLITMFRSGFKSTER